MPKRHHPIYCYRYPTRSKLLRLITVCCNYCTVHRHPSTVHPGPLPITTTTTTTTTSPSTPTTPTTPTTTTATATASLRTYQVPHPIHPSPARTPQSHTSPSIYRRRYLCSHHQPPSSPGRIISHRITSHPPPLLQHISHISRRSVDSLT